jgi:hypothetical protein
MLFPIRDLIMAGHLRLYKKVMKKYLIGRASMAGLNACNDSNSDVELKEPSLVHPPSEAIPGSTRLVNDFVIVRDIKVGNARQVGKSDSIQKTKQ